MWRSRVFFLACGLALLCVGQGPAGADDAALIDPSTTIVTVDGVPLSAGLILVPAGKDLEKWWAGEGHDSATQERVRKELATHSEAAVDTELLRAMLANIHERAGAAKAESFHPTQVKYMPIILSELRQKNTIDDWSQKSIDTEPYVSAWLTSRAEAEMLSIMMARALLERSDQSSVVRAHWVAHRDDYLVLQSACWRQITVESDQVMFLESLVLHPDEFESIAKENSLDRYRKNGGLVESKAPHLLIPDHIVETLNSAKLGHILRVNSGQQVILLKAESLNRVPGEFHEVSQQVRLDMARLKSGELAKRVAAKRRVQSRIEWEIPVNN